MRIVRLGALFGSLVLLVATSVSLVDRRTDLRVEQETRVAAAVAEATATATERVDGAVAATAIASLAADAVSDPDVRRALAREVAATVDGAAACVGTAVADCTADDLFALPVVGLLTGQAGNTGEPLAAVDDGTDSVVVVGRSPSTGVLTIVRIPLDALGGTTSADDVTLVVSGSSDAASDGVDEPEVVDGRRQIVSVVGDRFVEGSLIVTGDTDASFGLAGDATPLFVALLLLGTVLLALAGWTFFADRRTLEKRASTDELTGLLNRREFERVAAEAIETADRFQTGLCLMVLDLDGFKQVNDTLGHQFGDLVLKAVAERLVEAVRDTDIVGRWGGDEFIILLPGLADRAAVRNSAERISQMLGGSPVVGDTTMRGSIGAAIFPRHGNDLERLMRAADVAMYGAKTSGVSHRIADTLAVSDTLLGERLADSPAGPAIRTADYAGPDRRHSPVPPPPQPPPAPPTPPAGIDVSISDPRVAVERPDPDLDRDVDVGIDDPAGGTAAAAAGRRTIGDEVHDEAVDDVDASDAEDATERREAS